MKRIPAIAFFAMVNLAMAVAQSNSVSAKVPFDFTVGNKTLPAGTYTIRQQADHLIAVQSADKPITVFTLAHGGSGRPSKVGKLLFHRYGSQYYLSEILCDEADMNLELPTSKAEQRTALQEANLATRGETLVAAR